MTEQDTALAEATVWLQMQRTCTKDACHHTQCDYIRLLLERLRGLTAWIEMTCPVCKGHGYVGVGQGESAGQDWCSHCGGAGRWRECRYCEQEVSKPVTAPRPQEDALRPTDEQLLEAAAKAMWMWNHCAVCGGENNDAHDSLPHGYEGATDAEIASAMRSTLGLLAEAPPRQNETLVPSLMGMPIRLDNSMPPHLIRLENKRNSTAVEIDLRQDETPVAEAGIEARLTPEQILSLASGGDGAGYVPHTGGMGCGCSSCNPRSSPQRGQRETPPFTREHVSDTASRLHAWSFDERLGDGALLRMAYATLRAYAATLPATTPETETR